MVDLPLWLHPRPLTAWPGELRPRGKRRTSQYSATISTTRADLETELRSLRCRTFFTEFAIPEDEWRLDGRPRASAKLEHPGIVLSLPDSQHGALRYAADQFVSWQENLRSIVLTLEALRAVDRHGAVGRGEQYVGSKALPPGSIPMPAAAMSRSEALDFLTEHSDVPLGYESFREEIEFAFRAAAKRLHPDVGGDAALFQRLQEAAQVARQDS